MVGPLLDFPLLLILWIIMLQTMGGLVVMSCPALCKCSPGVFRVHVHCVGLNFTRMPQFPQTKDIEVLNLSTNGISAVPPNSFGEPQFLRELYLDHNQITALKTGELARMHNLTVLHLAHNDLRKLDGGVFRDLPSLEVLNLAANQLSSIPPDLFRMNRGLRAVDLSRNRLQSVPEGAFRDLPVLASLNLSHNPIVTIDVEDFRPLSSLHELRLANVSLGVLPQGVFNFLTHLKLLDLSHNQLTHVEASSLGSMRDLEVLDLSGNPFNCDCDIQGFYQWVHKVRGWVSVLSYCRHPGFLSGSSVYDVIPEHFSSCDGATNIDSFEITDDPASAMEQVDEQDIYNPMLGWYTAATLSAMLVAFLLCLSLDKLKRRLAKWTREKRRRREKLRYHQALQALNKAEFTEASSTLVSRTRSLERVCEKPSNNPWARHHSVNEKLLRKNNNSFHGRTPSVRNKPKLTLTLPESNNELELQGCMKKTDSNHDNRTISLEMETSPVNSFRIHPNCPIHSPLCRAKNIHVIADLESCL